MRRSKSDELHSLLWFLSNSLSLRKCGWICSLLQQVFCQRWVILHYECQKLCAFVCLTCKRMLRLSALKRMLLSLPVKQNWVGFWRSPLFGFGLKFYLFTTKCWPALDECSWMYTLSWLLVYVIPQGI